MNLNEVKEYFVTYSNAMRKIGLSRHAYLHWRADGKIPYVSQVKLSIASNGVLKVDEIKVNAREK